MPFHAPYNASIQSVQFNVLFCFCISQIHAIITIINFILCFLNYSMGVLHCCISFCYVAKWINYMYTFIPSFLKFPSHLGCHKTLNSLCSTESSHYLFYTWRWKWECYSFSCVWLFVTPWTVACQAPLSWNSSGKNTRKSGHFFLHGIFPTQGSNLGLQHCRQSFYHWATRAAHFIHSTVYKSTQIS